MILSTGFDHVEESFSFKEIQFKKFSPVLNVLEQKYVTEDYIMGNSSEKT